ncbi:hypothetical protein JZ751_016802 [Albula glossodonta]|uniref:Solute carrier family 16 member 7 n=1 Tax=Albula glossodonta TaxID=121402 RepID=A0A8T2NT15_9TELE|nr:hypothetical protein JZ751_016802 [Albula glossodonta]
MPPPAGGPQPITPPDGGWGWAVVLGSFISIGFSYAFPKAITVFFKDIQQIFGASYSQVAWISSIMLAVMYAGVLCASPIVSHISSWPQVMPSLKQSRAGGWESGAPNVRKRSGLT